MSSSEAEYVAMSEPVKEIRFMYCLLESLEISVKLPIIVRTDNTLVQSYGLRIHSQEFLRDISIPGTISFATKWKMTLSRSLLREKMIMMLIFLPRI